MAFKAYYFGDTNQFDKILAEEKPGKMKSYGRRVKGYTDEAWDAVKYPIVVAGNYAKFTSNPKLKDLLLQTEDREIAEASPIDKIWGVGCSATKAKDRANWKGENLLGKALMEVRQMIRDEEPCNPDKKGKAVLTGSEDGDTEDDSGSEDDSSSEDDSDSESGSGNEDRENNKNGKATTSK